MQIQLDSSFEKSVVGREAEAIIRKCVHCGFCLATCPTYQVLGDELDSPRGRIYLMKQFYEGQSPTKITQLHLDRCLTCRSCESTCPSGVQYGHLLEITKPLIENSVPRKITSQWWRKALSFGLTSKSFPVLIKLAKLANYLRMLPKNLAKKLPKATPLIYRVDHPKLWGSKSVSDSSRAFSQSHGAVLLLEGCVQNALAPNIQKASIKILEGMNFHIVSLPHEKCCGALPLHLGEKDKTLAYMRYNIDLWWPYIENGVLALVSNISGCGVMVKDYGTWLKNDPKYAEKSRIVSSLCLDISQFVTQHFDKLNIQGFHKELHTGKKIVFQ
ncbi:MAG: glycolate oxidase subunit GlcF, partial [Gammaproteobacteria bacterium]|nr:glycolate oxidase subunit GlcF [Gammaproteobacteria bacterium]